MLRAFAVALLAIAMSVGFAQARLRTPICVEGQQATATCICGVRSLGGQPLLCRKGQYCHGWSIGGCVSAHPKSGLEGTGRTPPRFRPAVSCLRAGR